MDQLNYGKIFNQALQSNQYKKAHMIV